MEKESENMNTILTGNALEVLKTLPSESVQMICTSPPYWNLRDYGIEQQIGRESSPTAYVSHLVDVFREAKRLLRRDGTLWLNLGDCYAGAGDRRGGKGDEHGQMKKHATPAQEIGLLPKNLIGIPWRVAFALQQDGWVIRSDIIWYKPNVMPEPTRDRPTSAHEHLFLLAKSEHYLYDADAVKERSVSDHPSGNGFVRDARLSYLNTDGSARGNAEQWQVTPYRNRRDVWAINTQPYAEAHFATMPPKLAEICILAGSRPGDTILDPFCGAGTTPLVALKLQRAYLGIELNPEYVRLAEQRIAEVQPTLWTEGIA